MTLVTTFALVILLTGLGRNGKKDIVPGEWEKRWHSMSIKDGKVSKVA